MYDLAHVIQSCVSGNNNHQNNSSNNSSLMKDNCLLVLHTFVDVILLVDSSDHDVNSNSSSNMNNNSNGISINSSSDFNMIYYLKLILLVSVKMIVDDTVPDVNEIITIINKLIFNNNNNNGDHLHDSSSSLSLIHI